MAGSTRSGRTAGSTSREVLRPHGQRILDLSRDRPQIPGTIPELADVDESATVYDGQALGYDAASGLHIARSRMYTFGTPGNQPLAAGISTGPLEFLYNGAAWKLQARLATAGTSTTTLVLRINGAAIATLNLAAGVLSNFVLVSAGSPPLPYVRVFAGVDVLTVVVTVAGAGAAGLQGYVAA